jgi:hypothetical protein
MTLKSNADVAFILMGGYDVLSKGPTIISENRESVLEEVTQAGDDTDNWGAVGEKRFELKQEGFYDYGAGRWNAALELSAPVVMMYAPVGNSIGDELVAFEGARTTYNRLPARGEFTKAEAVYKAEQGPAYGRTRIAAPLAAYAGDETLASYDWDAASSDGGRIFLEVTALDLDDADNLTVTVEHSTNDSDWDTLETFTVVTAAPASESIAVTGTIRRYTRVKIDFTGTPLGSETATLAVGIGRN